jgi:hypothetical protein
MVVERVPSLLEALSAVPDPRRARGRRYRLASVLTLAVCAMLSGARSLYAIAQWGRDHNAAEVRAALGISHADVPSVATLFRVFRDVDRDALEAALGRWVQAQVPAGERVVALDGKTLRGIHGEQVPGVHLVAALTHTSGQVRGQKGAVTATPN